MDEEDSGEEDRGEAPESVEPPSTSWVEPSGSGVSAESRVSPNVVEPPSAGVTRSLVEPHALRAAPTSEAAGPAPTGTALEWRELKARTVVLSGPVKGQPYRLALGGSVDDVLAFGPLNRNHEWHMTLKTEAAKQRLLDVERVTVKETCTFHVRSLLSPVTRVRVHWAPFYLPAHVIAA